jgi:Fur family ferric uptake transcriptional regulator
MTRSKRSDPRPRQRTTPPPHPDPAHDAAHDAAHAPGHDHDHAPPPGRGAGVEPAGADSGPAKRQTRQRSAIRQAIAEAGRPLTVHEILAAASSRLPGLGMATVYRTLKSLVDEGALRDVQVPASAVRYEPSGLAHHHHFLCRDCDRVYEMEGCVDLRHLTPPGFIMDGHEVLLLGRCARCQRTPPKRAGGARRAARSSGGAAPGAGAAGG